MNAESHKAKRPEITEPVITTGRVAKPRRCLIYGGPGVGKTTFAAGAPSPFFIQTEDGGNDIDGITRAALSTTFGDVMNNLRWLAARKHDYRTVVVDSLDALERLIWAKTCEDVPDDRGNRVERIEDYGFHKGYVHSLGYWGEFLRALDYLRNARGMNVVVIAHSAIRKFDDPAGDAYDRYEIGLDKRAAHTVLAWVDEAFFATQAVTAVATTQQKGAKKKGKGKGERIMRVEERPAYMAKNRLGLDVDSLPLSWEAYAAYFPGAAPAVEPETSAEPTTDEETNPAEEAA